MLDVKDLLFTVERSKKVYLHLGPITVEVCDKPEQFGDFVEELTRQLETIQKEIKEYCYE